MRRLQQAGVERIVIDRGVEAAEITQLVQALASADASQVGALAGLPHIRVGRLQVEERVDAPAGDIATFQRLYDDAVVGGRDGCGTARSAKASPIPDAARGIVDSLAQAVAQNRTALLALTALKNYDNYTFTHMVNVSILTMGQARGLGIEGALLREFGLAALMHDIGKVKTPTEILNKPDKLDDARVRDHEAPHGGRRRDPAAARRRCRRSRPIVAFEHHLRLRRHAAIRWASSAASSISRRCSAASPTSTTRCDRSGIYQQAFPTDRILAVLQRNDGKQFDQHLVRRFAQLVGIYPAGNLVRLDDRRDRRRAEGLRAGSVPPAREGADRGADGAELERPYEVNLWEAHDGQPRVDPGAARSRRRTESIRSSHL